MTATQRVEDAIAEVEDTVQRLKATYGGQRAPHEWYALNGAVASLFAVAREEIRRLSRARSRDYYWECPSCGSHMFNTIPIVSSKPEGPRMIVCAGPSEHVRCTFRIPQSDWHRMIGR